MVENFSDLWPYCVKLKGDTTHKTVAFAWLWGEVIKRGLDHKQVFTTYGESDVRFGTPYRRIAIHFKLRFG